MWDTACDFRSLLLLFSLWFSNKLLVLMLLDRVSNRGFLEVEGVAKVGFDVALALGITWFMQLSINSRSPFLINV